MAGPCPSTCSRPALTSGLRSRKQTDVPRIFRVSRILNLGRQFPGESSPIVNRPIAVWRGCLSHGGRREGLRRERRSESWGLNRESVLPRDEEPKDHEDKRK